MTRAPVISTPDSRVLVGVDATDGEWTAAQQALSAIMAA